MNLDKTISTSWNSNLRTMEMYIILISVLEKVLQTGPPHLLEWLEDSCIAECIEGFKEVRGFARQLEADFSVTASFVTRLLFDLYDTMDFFSADRSRRSAVLHFITGDESSTAAYNKGLNATGKVFLRESDARHLSNAFWNMIFNLLGNYFSPVSEDEAAIDLDITSEEYKKKNRLA